MEHIPTTLYDLFVFLIMIFSGSIVWLLTRNILLKVTQQSRLVEGISIILALGVGVLIINNFLLS